MLQPLTLSRWCLTFTLLATLIFGAEFEIKVSGILDPLGGMGASSSMNSALTGSLQTLAEVIYSDPVESHQLMYSEPGYVSVIFKLRGAERIALCLNRGAPCAARFDSGSGKVFISGITVDTEGMFLYENLLQLEKPAGTGYFITIFLMSERTFRTSSKVSVSSRPRNVTQALLQPKYVHGVFLSEEPATRMVSVIAKKATSGEFVTSPS